MLDLSTLRWSKGSVPCLPAPRGSHSACGGNGRIVVVGGLVGAVGAGADAVSTAVHWRRGSASWYGLPFFMEAKDREGRLPSARLIAEHRRIGRVHLGPKG